MQITNYKVNKNIMNSVAVTKSLIGAKLPYELVEYIWSFNYFWASNIIQKYTKKYISKKVKYIIRMLDDGYIGSFNLFIYYNVEDYENKMLITNNLIRTLNVCDCCNRHKINKPKKFERWIETPFNSQNNKYNCHCKCRLHSRMLCRSFKS